MATLWARIYERCGTSDYHSFEDATKDHTERGQWVAELVWY